MMNVVMLSAVTLNVVMLNVVAAIFFTIFSPDAKGRVQPSTL
jgi:hypothetical protein